MSLSVFTGPMFSGKTSRVIQSLTFHSDIQDQCKCILINSKDDTRDPQNIISSHSSSYKGLSNKVLVCSTKLLKDINIDEYDVIGIDEAQFFNDLVETIKLWISKDKHIYVSGLDSDFMGEPFGHINKILHMSDDFIKLKTKCGICLKSNPQITKTSNYVDASFTALICKNEKEDNINKIGGKDLYIPMCRIHHREYITNN